MTFSAATSQPCDVTQTGKRTEKELVQQAIEHATHWLPAQGPISVFVHHNTLHAFEELPFEQAVVKGGELYNCEPYLSEARYHKELTRGRIRLDDLRAVLLEDLQENADAFVASFGTRYALRLAMLQYPIVTAADAELEWLIAETAACDQFRPDVGEALRLRTIEQTKAWLSRFQGSLADNGSTCDRDVLSKVLSGNLKQSTEAWSDKKWESFTLRFLWQVCADGVQLVTPSLEEVRAPCRETVRMRDFCMAATGRDSDQMVDELLIRFCACFLDQGFANWQLPHRDLGFLEAFARLYSTPSTPVPRWMKGLREELQKIVSEGIGPYESIVESMRQLGVEAIEKDEFILQSLLALRGWAGLIWQMETNAPWTPRPAPKGSLAGYLAVRLLLERAALASIARQELPGLERVASFQPRHRERKLVAAPTEFEWFCEIVRTGACSHPKRYSIETTFVVFQLAQLRGWGPHELLQLSAIEWKQLITEIQQFSELERRRLLHLAYERTYYRAALDALICHSQRKAPDLRSLGESNGKRIPAYQVVCCIDDREESFRRHLEECDPESETFGAPGFFAVAMYYQSASDAHYRPLCPIVITPKHYVREEPVFSAIDLSHKRTQRRRLVGHMTYQVHAGSRTLLGGIATGILGTFATFPLVARILAPRLTAQLRKVFGGFVSPPATELHIERVAEAPGQDADQLGYSVSEMAAIVTRAFQDIGLVKDFASIVLFVGHGSSSLNNPHESAYNCGACSGGRGGPNARSFALMANDRRVRAILTKSGIAIPDDVWVVGAYHNTCNDLVEYYDLDLLPRSHRELFRRIERSVNDARCRNAHERVRRFESAAMSLSRAESLEHVEERSEDLSQARPEYNHATNALCFVGRREWSRGLYLDRRAFLTSYDPRLDDENASILTRILAAAIPVCAGINLEYFFSTVDSEGYGCGSKLPHNISGLAGVMTGAASDIRPGLSAQMVEIHEPIRILFAIETTPAKMLRIMDSQPMLGRLIRNYWVQLSLFEPETGVVYRFEKGAFEPYVASTSELPQVASSMEWYGGHRDHLGFASISEIAKNRTKQNSESSPKTARGEAS